MMKALLDTMVTTADGQTVIVSLVVLLISAVWLIYARLTCRPKAAKYSGGVVDFESADAALLDEEQEDERWVKNRTTLCLKQMLYYAMALYYLVNSVAVGVRVTEDLVHSDKESSRPVLILVSTIARFAAWFIAARAEAAEYKSTRTRNGAFAFVFVSLAALSAWRQTTARRALSYEQSGFWVFAVHGPLLLLALPWTHGVQLANSTPSAEELAVEFHEVAFFTWLNCLFEAKLKQSAGEKLAESDLPALMHGDRVAQTWPNLEKQIGQLGRKKPTTFGLFRMLLKLTWPHFAGAGYCRLFYVVAGYAQPLALYVVLRRFGKKHDTVGWAAVGALFFGPMVAAWLDSMQMFMQRRVATRCRGALMILLFDKGTRLDMQGGGGRVGEVVALMSADVQNVLTAVSFFHWTWGPLLQLAITLSALFWLVGVAAFGALAIIALNSLANGRVFQRLTVHNKAFLQARSHRMDLITEALQGSRVVKMLALERGIAASIAARRDSELAVLKKLLGCFVQIFTLINSTPPLMGLATFLLMATVLGNRFDAAIGFTTLSLLENLRFVLLQAPSAMNNIVTGWVSLQRIENYLDAPEVDGRPPVKEAAPKGSISIVDADFSWSRKETTNEAATNEIENPLLPEEPTLRNISLEVEAGQLVVVVGITGGGKSSLLASLIGEITRTRGEVFVNGTVAYCPQQSWCQNATVRDNVTFGSPFDAEKFDRCVAACCLEADLAQFPAGEMTEIGERGISLSGGQQQRIQLCRALYHDADIFVLDDPLSAVDALVGEHLYRRVVGEMLIDQGKTVILATHQVSLAMQKADHVVILAVDGTIAAQGTPEELKTSQRGRDLLDSLQEHEQPVKPVKKTVKKVEKKKPAPSTGQLVNAEERKAGAPALKVFGLYLGAAGPWFVLGACIFAIMQPIKYVQSLALTKWIRLMSKGASPLENSAVWLYTGWTAVFVVLSALGVIFQNRGALRAARKLHERLTWAVLRCPTSWYDRSPVGRIQNRFSTDIQAVDRQVSNSVQFTIRSVISPLVSLYSIGSSLPWLLPCFLPVFAAAARVALTYLYCARDLKRIDSTTKSPVYACFNESLNGLATLRAFEGATERFKLKFMLLVDRTNSAELHLFATNFWLSTRLNTLGATVSGLTCLVLYARPPSSSSLDPPTAGLVLTYAISFTGAMIMLLRTYTDLELALNSVERIQEYLEIKPEPPLLADEDAPSTWLIETPGEVRLENVTLRYTSAAEPALRSLSMVFPARESIGVCGRTGAGKSTLLQCLLRLYPIEGGRVLIDGVDIADVGLRTLRGRVAIVPQDPTIFSGTVRYNLDMFGERTDAELTSALQQSRGSDLSSSSSSSSLFSVDSSASLTSEVEAVAELSLDFVVSEFGTNLSVGERQLLCLARAIARNSRLVLMDEATANVDQTTDRRIQRLLRTGSLSHATRITIAHRLGTIVFCDKVAVLSQGQLAEYAPPSVLLEDADSAFFSMCQSAGNITQLRAAAKRADADRAASDSPSS